MVGPGGWTTRINADNDVEWIPPPELDTGQARVNDYHRPERLSPTRRRTVPTRRTPAENDDHPHQPGGPEPNAA